MRFSSAVSVLGVFALLTAAPHASAINIPVTSTLDDLPVGTPRSAITQANGTLASDTITFAIGSGAVKITLASALPALSNPTIIDGTTQPGYAGQPLVEIDGHLVTGIGFRMNARS